MKITAIAPWFGSKRTLAPRIVEALGPHRCYWEPFCGSMAVLLEKPPVRMETVNDLHADLVNLARVVQHPMEGPRLYRRLRRTWAQESVFHDCAARFNEEWSGEVNTDRAFVYFVASWLGRSGIAGTNIGQRRGAGHSFCVRYTGNGGQANARWYSAINSIPQWRERMRNVVILNRDGFEVLDRIDDAPDVAVYLDPPYLTSTRTGWSSDEGGHSRYRHDFTAGDHERLAKAMTRFKRARVVVSYYDSPQLADLYPKWRKIDCAMTKPIAAANKRGNANTTKAPEVLLVNDLATPQSLYAMGDRNGLPAFVVLQAGASKPLWFEAGYLAGAGVPLFLVGRGARFRERHRETIGRLGGWAVSLDLPGDLAGALARRGLVPEAPEVTEGEGSAEIRTGGG